MLCVYRRVEKSKNIFSLISRTRNAICFMIVCCLAYPSILKMKETCTSETLCRQSSSMLDMLTCPLYFELNDKQFSSETCTDIFVPLCDHKYSSLKVFKENAIISASKYFCQQTPLLYVDKFNIIIWMKNKYLSLFCGFQLEYLRRILVKFVNKYNHHHVLHKFCEC